MAEKKEEKKAFLKTQSVVCNVSTTILWIMSIVDLKTE